MLEQLQPKSVFTYFEKLTQIPRGSGNTKQVSDYLANFAKERNLRYIQDEVGNVIIFGDATKGYEDQTPIIIQGHMDIVAVKDEDCDLDLQRDSLELEIDGDYISANKTSLGGDDGIAIAYALAILDSDEICHPALEVVITIDEEVGMDGAAYIDLSECKGKTFINIDSEEEGIFTVSCAGGLRVYGKIEKEEEAYTGKCYEVSLEGLTGGHSGAEIHHGRANANILMGQIAAKLFVADEIKMCSIEGGTKDNVIACAARMLIAFPDEMFCNVKEKLCDIEAELKETWKSTDPSLKLTIVPKGSCEKAFTKETAMKVINVLTNVPNGVQAMCEDMPDLVETSLNLGVLFTNDTEIGMDFSLRSSVKAAKEELKNKVINILLDKGAKYQVDGDYPAWEYKKESPIRDKMIRVYREMYHKDPEVLGIHAGLECGIMAQKIEGLDCISIGPNMKDIHTTRERLSISSTQRVWEFLLNVLK